MRQYRLFICFFMLCLFSDLTAQNILVKGTVMERTWRIDTAYWCHSDDKRGHRW